MSKTTAFGRGGVVLGAILIQLCLGAIYAWSVFTPLLSEAGWSKLQTQLVFSLGLGFFALSMVWAGKRLAVWGPRRLTMAGGLVLGAGYVLAGLLGAANFWVLAVCIGVIGGTGIGLGYVVPIAVGIRWFPDRKGMITGLAVAGFGFGAMGWIKLAGSWGHLLDTLGLSATFMIYGALFAGLVLLGSVWMVFPEEDSAGRTTASPAAAGAGKEPKKAGLASGEMIRTLPFYLIFLTFVFGAGAGLMSIGLMKLYPMEALQRAGLSAVEASGVAGTAMAVFFSLANGLGRIIWGVVSDRLGRKRSIVLMMSLQGAAVFAFIVMAGTPALLYLGATLIGFNFGGNFALFPTLTADLFGADRVGENYPFVFLAYGAGGILGPVLGGLLGDMGNFPLAFGICGGLCWLGAALAAAARKPEPRAL